MTAPQESRAGWRDGMILVALGVVLAVGGRAAVPDTAAARDLDGRYADSPLKGWFDSLHSGKGPCCSDADGTALSDIDWEARDGHYRVRIEGQWWDVPDDAVIREPNRAGRTMVWPIYYRAAPRGNPLLHAGYDDVAGNNVARVRWRKSGRGVVCTPKKTAPGRQGAMPY